MSRIRICDIAQFKKISPAVVIGAARRCGLHAENVTDELLDTDAGNVMKMIDKDFNSTHNLPISPEVLECAVAIAAGVSQQTLARFYSPATMNAALSAEYHDAGIHTLLKAKAEQLGMSTFQRQWNDAALMRIVAHTSLLDIGGILSNVADKILIEQSEAVEVMWPVIAAERPARSLRPQSRYQIVPGGRFAKVSPSGELKHLNFTEEGAYEAVMQTSGCLIRIDRRAIYNDDLGTLDGFKSIARLSSLAIEEAVMITFLGNVDDFFHANNTNLLTGGSSVLSATSLAAAATLLRNRVDANGLPLLVSPRILLTPPELEGAGKTAWNVMEISEALGTAIRRPYVSPYLSNAAIKTELGTAIPNQSATAWYLLADPRQCAAVGIAFLNGRRAPTVEKQSSPMGYLGIEMRAYHDFGVAYEDSRGAVKSNGA